MITFDLIGEVITVANSHFTMYSIKYFRLDYIRARYLTCWWDLEVIWAALWPRSLL